MFIVYVLRSALNRRLYVGFTENLEERLNAHNQGAVSSTKSHRPWRFIFYECYTNKGDALRREQYFKTTAGKRGLKMMLRQALAE